MGLVILGEISIIKKETIHSKNPLVDIITAKLQKLGYVAVRNLLLTKNFFKQFSKKSPSKLQIDIAACKGDQIFFIKTGEKLSIDNSFLYRGFAQVVLFAYPDERSAPIDDRQRELAKRAGIGIIKVTPAGEVISIEQPRATVISPSLSKKILQQIQKQLVEKQQKQSPVQKRRGSLSTRPLSQQIIIIDGSNIARTRYSGKETLVEDLLKVKEKALALGAKKVLIIVSSGLYRFISDDKEKFERLVRSRMIIQAKKGSDDDELIIRRALKYDALIITNDGFNDEKKKEKYPEEILNDIKKRLITCTFDDYGDDIDLYWTAKEEYLD